VIEARDRIGGRIFTVHDPRSPVPIELGAEFVHGEPPVTFAIARAARLSVVELPQRHVAVVGGRVQPMKGFWRAVVTMTRDLARRAKRRGRDFAVSEYFERARLTPERRTWLRDFVEGYHAARPELLSARWVSSASDELDDDASERRQFRLPGGYDAVIRWLRDNLNPHSSEVRLRTVAHALEWREGDVVARCRTEDGAAANVHARAAVIALPHAVLRAGELQFEPRLPAKERALARLEPGDVFKIVLRFRRSFWKDDVLFFYAHGETIPGWWTAVPAHAPVLTGWVGGPRAQAFLANPPEVRLEQTLDALARVFAVPRPSLDDQLDDWASHDWRADPFSRAAYTYVGVGGVGAPRALARPVSGTLFFAGEATEGEQMGTVAGALHSGRRAAREVIRALRG